LFQKLFDYFVYIDSYVKSRFTWVFIWWGSRLRIKSNFLHVL